MKSAIRVFMESMALLKLVFFLDTVWATGLSLCSQPELHRFPAVCFIKSMELSPSPVSILCLVIKRDNSLAANCLCITSRRHRAAGPPGTGKTSLAKAAAQKLSIQLSDRYAIVGKRRTAGIACYLAWTTCAHTYLMSHKQMNP